MEFNELRYFLKAAQHNSFTRAADELGISQPALSRAVGRLETELGQPLFERQTRRVELTDAGALLKSRALEVMAILDDAKAEISDDGESGRIRLAAIPTIAPFILPAMLSSFEERFPKASVVVQEDVTESTLHRITQGEIDLAILALPISAKYLEIETLFEEELLLVMPVDHPLSKRRKIKLSDIEPLPFVLLSEAHCLADNIISFCRKRSFHPISVERTSQLTTVQELVSLDHGVSMIPAMARKVDESQRRVYRSLVDPKPTRKIVMVWNPYRFESRLMKRFKDFVREFAASIS
ncbi:MAG: LysR family transcriptional regulator [bacterium]|nr:LysR family transcriptional regulator [bacterium]